MNDICSEPGCPASISRAGRCARHAAGQDKERGSGWERYGPLHRETRKMLLETHQAGRLCMLCGEVLPMNPDLLDTHHVVEKARGGTDGPGNEVLVHRGCNRSSAYAAG